LTHRQTCCPYQRRQIFGAVGVVEKGAAEKQENHRVVVGVLFAVKQWIILGYTMPTYYPNDVVCRVRSGSGGGTEIDVGTVDYPLTTCGPLGPKSLEQLLAGGFEEGWDISVTWGHRNVLEGRRNDIPVDKRREKINSSDQMVTFIQ